MQAAALAEASNRFGPAVTRRRQLQRGDWTQRCGHGAVRVCNAGAAGGGSAVALGGLEISGAGRLAYGHRGTRRGRRKCGRHWPAGRVRYLGRRQIGVDRQHEARNACDHRRGKTGADVDGGLIGDRRLPPAVVTPRLVVVSIEYKQAPVVLTQLPPGALRAICGPRLLNPTLVPAWRRPATATTFAQFAGASTGPPSLPAAATTVTPALVSWVMTSA